MSATVPGFGQLLLAAAACVQVASASEPRLRVSSEVCKPADVVLINQDGQKVRLKQILESGDPVVLNFIYGHCTTICPTLSAGYATLQGRLGASSGKVHLISITIDPDRDTPKALKDYMRRFRARPGWDCLTGSRRDIDAAMHGMNTFIPDLSSMVPITMIRPAGSEQWVRIFGLMSSSEFIEQCRRTGIL
ncbi:MAG: SCO family protein [Geothrix sp.]|uniref:SCO family protein n=1 Tax=Geothrix sp. TaxID=1962974 RepID=UPI0017F163B5|nr:SCO family protein [Geothrix sp.]NWJ40395.1 SCO family protein [Geothrix sp.]WIL21598.1 MAG: SCO family protein [Geothrix sp.]